MPIPVYPGSKGQQLRCFSLRELFLTVTIMSRFDARLTTKINIISEFLPDLWYKSAPDTFYFCNL